MVLSLLNARKVVRVPEPVNTGFAGVVGGQNQPPIPESTVEVAEVARRWIEGGFHFRQPDQLTGHRRLVEDRLEPSQFLSCLEGNAGVPHHGPPDLRLVCRFEDARLAADRRSPQHQQAAPRGREPEPGPLGR
jgi:hypothetical protein